jgi:hypothetical protein
MPPQPTHPYRGATQLDLHRERVDVDERVIAEPAAPRSEKSDLASDGSLVGSTPAS